MSHYIHTSNLITLDLAADGVGADDEAWTRKRAANTLSDVEGIV